MNLNPFKKEEPQQIVYEQEPMPPQQGGGYGGYPMVLPPSEKADLYDKIRPEDVVEQCKYLLMGYEFDNQQQRWKPNHALSEVALSEVGATQISTLLFPVSNKSVSISKLEDDEIRLRTKFLVRTAMKNCLEKWEAYGIKTPAALLFVKEVILSIAFITLKQPEGAGVRHLIQGTLQETRMVSEQAKKEGLFSNMFRK